MKQIIILIFSLVIVSCTQDTSLEKYLAAQEKFELERHERKLNAISNLLMESPNKELQVKNKLKKLDSLYEKAIERINNGDDLKVIFENFKNSSQELIKYEYSNWKLIFSEVPNSYQKLAGTIALTKAKTSIMGDISMEVSRGYMYDQLELIVVPKKEVISLNENYEAEVIFAAFSSKSEEFMSIVLNNEDTLDIKNGKGKITISPKNKGRHSFKIRMYDKLGLDLSDEFILEKEITYEVK